MKHRTRNIPAYAGKTTIPERFGGLTKEHPRVRGENPQLPTLVTPKNGTSPRTRGKLTRPHGIRVHNRNIPAYAGKTPNFPLCSCSATEHPRVRGEN